MARATNPTKKKKEEKPVAVARKKVTKKKTMPSKAVVEKKKPDGLKKAKTSSTPKSKSVTPTTSTTTTTTNNTVESKKKKTSNSTATSKPKDQAPVARRKVLTKRAKKKRHIRRPSQDHMIISVKDYQWTCQELGCELEAQALATTYEEQVEHFAKHWRKVHGEKRLDMKTLKCVMSFSCWMERIPTKVELNGTFRHWFEKSRNGTMDLPEPMHFGWFAITGDFLVCLTRGCPLDRKVHLHIPSGLKNLHEMIEKHMRDFHAPGFTFETSEVDYLVKIREETWWSHMNRDKVKDWVDRHRKKLSFEDYMFKANGGTLVGEEKEYYSIMGVKRMTY